MKKERGLSEALLDIEQTMPGFARWMYGTARRDLGEHVMDAGSGIGTYTELLLKDGKRVVSLEFQKPFVERLEGRFGGDGRVIVRQADLSNPGDFAGLPVVDSVLCLNVLEHVTDDVQAMRNLHDSVRPGGKLVALVPAYPWLFNKMDTAVGHVKRYGKREFLANLREAGWTVERCFRFNAFGIPGWFVAGSILKRSTPGRDLTRLFDLLVPVFAFLERYVLLRRVGLSLVAVCRRDD
jgi:SAM-dependent methyltransferase